MTVTLSRRVQLETVEIEVYAGRDGQGMASYDSAVEIEARVVREDAVVMISGGTEVKTVLTLWVPGDQSPLPGDQDRITYESEAYVVVDRKEGKTLKGVIDHVRAQCREE